MNLFELLIDFILAFILSIFLFTEIIKVLGAEEKTLVDKTFLVIISLFYIMSVIEMLYLLIKSFSIIIPYVIPFIIILLFIIFIDKMAQKRNRKDSMTKIDFKNEQNYYREILNEYTPAELSYIDDFYIKHKRELVSTILNLQLKNKIEIKKTNDTSYISIIDDNVYDLRKTEEYVLKQMQNEIKEKFISDIFKKKEIINKYAEDEALMDGLIEPVSIEEKEKNRKKVLIKLFFATVIVVILTILHFKYIMPVLYDFSFSDSNIWNIKHFYSIILAGFPVILFFGLKNYYDSYISSQKNTYKRTELGEQINIKLEGLRNYISDYSLLNEKDKEDLVLWREYLIYSVILGVNHKKIVKEIFDGVLKEEGK